MTKRTILLLTFFMGIHLCAQDFKELMSAVKSEFEKPFHEQDMKTILPLAEKAIEMEPNNPQALYYLGYIYDRVNAHDATEMLESNVVWTMKSSEMMERLCALENAQIGEILTQDPYSKITSVWSGIAMKYYYTDDIDSAKWALEEGKRRGGFGDFILAYNRFVLDAMDKKAILLSSGDLNTFPLFYLQVMEDYRTDVSVIDLTMLNTVWYPQKLRENKVVKFGMKPEMMDTIDYTVWENKEVSIGKQKLKVKASYYDAYLLRGDRILLDILKKNKFKRPVAITTGIPANQLVGLLDICHPYICYFKAFPKENYEFDLLEYHNEAEKLLQLAPKMNQDCRGETRNFDNLRFLMLYHVNNLYNKENRKEEAKALFDLLKENVETKKYAFAKPSGMDYYHEIKAYFY